MPHIGSLRTLGCVREAPIDPDLDVISVFFTRSDPSNFSDPPQPLRPAPTSPTRSDPLQPLQPL